MTHNCDLRSIYDVCYSFLYPVLVAALIRTNVSGIRACYRVMDDVILNLTVPINYFKKAVSRIQKRRTLLVTIIGASIADVGDDHAKAVELGAGAPFEPCD